MKISGILGALLTTLGLSGLALAFVLPFLLYTVVISFAIIWALNTLFNLNIPYTIWTVLAVVVLSWFVGATKATFKRNENQ